MAVIDDAREIVEEVRVENANLDDLAQRYAGSRAVIKATSNYYHVYDTLAEYLGVTTAHPGKLTHIAQSDKKTDRVDAKELARLLWQQQVCCSGQTIGRLVFWSVDWLGRLKLTIPIPS